MSVSDEDLAWLRLSLVGGVGVEQVLELCKALDGFENIFHAGYGTLTKIVGEVLARKIAQNDCQSKISEILSWLDGTLGAGFVKLTDDDYPQQMIRAGVAPLVLFFRGNRSLLKRPMLTVCGSGRPDREGEFNARNFGEALGKAKSSAVLSIGLYPGSETVFLRAAVEQSGASVIVWGATGPNRIWPRENASLLSSVLEQNGLLVTPFPPGTSISEEGKEFQVSCRMAAADALLVIRASQKSKALRMARMAADWGRDVFVIPGSIHDMQSRGCHRLIQQGAKLVQSAVDIVEGLGQAS